MSQAGGQRPNDFIRFRGQDARRVHRLFVATRVPEPGHSERSRIGEVVVMRMLSGLVAHPLEEPIGDEQAPAIRLQELGRPAGVLRPGVAGVQGLPGVRADDGLGVPAAPTQLTSLITSDSNDETIVPN